MDYKKVYTENYFSGKDSFFYSLGYGRLSKFYFQSIFNPIKPYLNKLEKGKILDIGCAYGFILKKIPNVFERFGVDVSEYALNQAKQINPGADFKIANAEEPLPFPREYFDIIICNDVIEHLENPAMAIENIKKVLKKDGVFYLNTPNLNWLRKNLFAYADKKEHHVSLFKQEDLIALLERSGFEILEKYTYTSIAFFFFIKFHSNIGHEQAIICRKI